ncbi:MAG: hypothetical protein IT379_07085 [Deltaproteobacteria bacterium]|nr:hypothetical protein [Deltaproteobacteria bacterium]
MSSMWIEAPLPQAANADVVEMQGWQREMLFPETGSSACRSTSPMHAPPAHPRLVAT